MKFCEARLIEDKEVAERDYKSGNQLQQPLDIGKVFANPNAKK